MAIDDLTLHELLLTPRLATDTHGGASVPGSARVAHVPSATFIFTIIIFIMLGLQWLHLFEEKHYWCSCVHIAPWFWPRTRTFPLLSLKSYYMNLFFSIFCVDLRINIIWTLRLWTHSSTAWRALLIHTRIMFFPSELVCHTTAMCFTLSIASPLLYTCSFTQRPKPSGGKGAKSLLKRQRGSAFVSEWAHLRRRKRDWQSLRTRRMALVAQAVSHTYTAVSFSSDAHFLCSKWPLEWRTSRHRHVVVKPSPYRTTQLYFIYKKMLLNCFIRMLTFPFQKLWYFIISLWFRRSLSLFLFLSFPLFLYYNRVIKAFS